jgi:hypothetical protein
LIFLVACDKKGRVIFMGRLYIGKNVDMVVFKEELSGFDWTNIRIWVDLGFIGIEKTLSNMKE